MRRAFLRATLVLLTLCLCLSSPPEAGAQPSGNVADEADAYFWTATRAYQAGDYEAALAHYLSSQRLSPNPNVAYNIARCYEQLQRFVEAYRYYAIALETQSGELERAELSAALQRMRSEVSLIELDSEPSGATVFVGRRELGAFGVTPLRLALAPGSYQLLLERENHEPFVSDPIQTQAGSTTQLLARLTPLMTTLELRGEPEGASIELMEGDNALLLGQLPATLQLAVGSCELRLSHPGYYPQEHTLTLGLEPTLLKNLSLERQTGTIIVESTELGALVWLDGRRMGFTPTVLEKVPVGSREVKVSSSGYQPYVALLEVSANGEHNVMADLRASGEISTASRQLETLQTAPASVSVIGPKELELQAYSDLAEAVRGVRGFFVSNDYQYASLGTRGFSLFGQFGNRLQVQLDGHVLNEAWVGGSMTQSELLQSLLGIEQIEVLRGPGSAVYGSGAFLGVINLVTPKQVDEIKLQGRISSSPSSAVGGLRAAASAQLPWTERGGLLVSAGATQTQDDELLRNGGISAAGAMLKLWWRDWTVQGYFNHHHRALMSEAYGTLPQGSSATDQRSFVELRFEPAISEQLQLFSRLYFDFTRYEGVFAYEGEDEASVETWLEDFLGLSAGGELRAVYRPLQALRLTMGGEYRLHGLVSSEGSYVGEPFLKEDSPFHVLSGYAVGDWKLTPWMTLSLGGRFDGTLLTGLNDPEGLGEADDRFLYDVNPRLAAIFFPDQGSTIKVLGGRAFRAPSNYELTYNDGGLSQVPSPHLQPESIITAELEYSQQILEQFKLVSAVFLNHISDLIRQHGEGTEEDPLYLANEADAFLTLGLELELRRDFANGWMMALSYAYQRTRNGELFSDANNLAATGGERRGRIANSPEHLASFMLLAPLFSPSIRLGTRLCAESGRLDREGGEGEWVLLWDATLSADLGVPGLTLALGARNLLDWQYALPVGEDLEALRLAQAGRRVFVELAASY